MPACSSVCQVGLGQVLTAGSLVLPAASRRSLTEKEGASAPAPAALQSRPTPVGQAQQQQQLASAPALTVATVGRQLAHASRCRSCLYHLVALCQRLPTRHHQRQRQQQQRRLAHRGRAAALSRMPQPPVLLLAQLCQGAGCAAPCSRGIETCISLSASNL